MAFDIGSIVGRVELNLDSWKKAVSEMRKDQESLAGAALRHSESLKEIGKTITVVGGVIAGSMAMMIKKTVDYGEELYKTSQRVGVSVEMLSGLKLAADKADIGMEGLSLGLKQLSVAANEANTGNKEAAEKFKLLGVSVADATGKLLPANEILYAVADKFKTMPDGVQKTAMAVDLFGRSGAAMIPLLNSGSEGLKREREEAERLGLVLSEKTAKASDEFNDSLTQAKAAVMGASMAFVQSLIPALTSMANTAATLISWFGKFIDISNKISGGIIPALILVLGGLAVAIGPILIMLPRLIQGWTVMSTTILGPLKTAISSFVGSLSGLTIGLTAALAGVIAINAAIVAYSAHLDNAIYKITEESRIEQKNWQLIHDAYKNMTPVMVAAINAKVNAMHRAGETADVIAKKVIELFKLETFSANEWGKAVKKISEDELRIRTDLTRRINELTMSEYQFAKWSINQEYDAKKEELKKINADSETMARLEKARQIELSKIYKNECNRREKEEKDSFNKEKKELLQSSRNWQLTFKIIDKATEDFLKNTTEQVRLSADEIGDFFAETENRFSSSFKKMGMAAQNWAKGFEKTLNEKILPVVDMAMQTMSMMFDTTFNRRMAELDAWYEKEKETLDKSNLNEEEKKKKLEELDAEYAEKQKAAKKQYAQQQKAMAIIDAIINTAVGVTMALSSSPPPFNVILAAITAALGAVQIALISRQPLAMAEGGMTKSEGMALLHPNEVVMPFGNVEKMLGMDKKKNERPIQNIVFNIKAEDAASFDKSFQDKILPRIKKAIKTERLQFQGA